MVLKTVGGAGESGVQVWRQGRDGLATVACAACLWWSEAGAEGVFEAVLAPRWGAGNWNRVIPGPSRPRAEFFGPFGPLGLGEAGAEDKAGADVARDATPVGVGGCCGGDPG